MLARDERGRGEVRKMLDRYKIEDAVRGLDWPVSKEEILSHVRSRGIDPEVMTFFEAIPDLKYERPEEVARMMPGQGPEIPGSYMGEGW